MAEVVRTAPAEFIEAGAKTYLDDLTKAIGQFKTTDLSTIMGPQFVAGPGAECPDGQCPEGSAQALSRHDAAVAAPWHDVERAARIDDPTSASDR